MLDPDTLSQRVLVTETLAEHVRTGRRDVGRSAPLEYEPARSPTSTTATLSGRCAVRGWPVKFVSSQLGLRPTCCELRSASSPPPARLLRRPPRRPRRRPTDATTS